MSLQPVNRKQRNFTRIGKQLLKVAGYVLAFCLPPLVVGFGVYMRAGAALMAAGAPVAAVAPKPPAHDPAKPTVVVLASNEGTEITDLLAPYAVFSAADAFNVYVAAPKREVTPFLWGGLDFLPHYSFAELDQLLGGNPDVIVVPYVKNPEDATLVRWIQGHAGAETLVVSICGGAHVLAATGLADGLQVTTHTNYFPLLEKGYPQLHLVRGVRYTDNGNVITSAGITAGIDASLYTIKRLLGLEAAQAVAAKLNYPHAQFLEAPAYQLPRNKAAVTTMGLNAAFILDKAQIGVPLFDGVNEIDLTAVLDSYGRTFAGMTTTFAPQRQAIRSRYGLDLVPRYDYDTAPQFDRVLIPGEANAPVAGLAEWAQTRQRVTVEYLYPSGPTDGARPFAFDVTLADLAQWSSTPDARSSATTLEYPIEHLQLAAKQWPVERLASGLLVGLASLGLTVALGQWLRRRNSVAVAA